MSKPNGNGRSREPGGRSDPRANVLREIAISCEGQDETILAKPPNLSKGGMFINTSRCFPEGTVLNLRFELLTGAQVEARCEVRYCRPGVGVGVQFIGLSDTGIQLIEREIEQYQNTHADAIPRRHTKGAATPVRSRRRA